jgi:hypothetical protein
MWPKATHPKVHDGKKDAFFAHATFLSVLLHSITHNEIPFQSAKNMGSNIVVVFILVLAHSDWSPVCRYRCNYLYVVFFD